MDSSCVYAEILNECLDADPLKVHSPISFTNFIHQFHSPKSVLQDYSFDKNALAIKVGSNSGCLCDRQPHPASVGIV
jgi:hypothetical protein